MARKTNILKNHQLFVIIAFLLVFGLLYVNITEHFKNKKLPMNKRQFDSRKSSYLPKLFLKMMKYPKYKCISSFDEMLQNVKNRVNKDFPQGSDERKNLLKSLDKKNLDVAVDKSGSINYLIREFKKRNNLISHKVECDWIKWKDYLTKICNGNVNEARALFEETTSKTNYIPGSFDPFRDTLNWVVEGKCRSSKKGHRTSEYREIQKDPPQRFKSHPSTWNRIKNINNVQQCKDACTVRNNCDGIASRYIHKGKEIYPPRCYIVPDLGGNGTQCSGNKYKYNNYVRADVDWSPNDRQLRCRK